MWITTCEADEQLLIGDEVRITVVEINDGQVRLGVEAPRDIHVQTCGKADLEAGSQAVDSTDQRGVS